MKRLEKQLIFRQFLEDLGFKDLNSKDLSILRRVVAEC